MPMWKNYIWWSAKAFETQYWDIINLSLKFDDLKNIVNNKWYCQISVMKRKEVWQYGDTHYVVENEYNKNSEQWPTTDDKWDIPF